MRGGNNFFFFDESKEEDPVCFGRGWVPFRTKGRFYVFWARVGSFFDPVVRFWHLGFFLSSLGILYLMVWPTFEWACLPR